MDYNLSQRLMQEKIAISVCTYRRPDGLRACLQSIAKQGLPNELQNISCDIVVIDNDPNTETEVIINQVQQHCSYKIVLLKQPIQGLSEARNTALAYVREQKYAALIFIDDDEQVQQEWLKHLLRTWKNYQAPIVTGPVSSIAGKGVPKWLEFAQPFAAKSLPTGKEMRVAYTNNTLICGSVYLNSNIIFDSKFSRTGGEDVHFFSQLAKSGYLIIWCNEAVVTEEIPSSRASLGWIMRRGFRVGASWTRSIKILSPMKKAFVKISIYSGWRFLRTIGVFLCALVTLKRSTLYSALFYGAQALGTLVAMFFPTHSELIKEYL